MEGAGRDTHFVAWTRTRTIITSMATPRRLTLNSIAATATVHCLTGCAIGEVLGMVVGTALGWGNIPTIVLAVLLAFVFGYGLTLLPLLRAGLAPGTAMTAAFASDTASITVMEIVDNAIMLVIPGAMDAGLGSGLFWFSLAFALIVAAFPVNRYLIARGMGTRSCTNITGTDAGMRAPPRHGRRARRTRRFPSCDSLCVARRSPVPLRQF
jgi:hypothetical protein